jgi:hypothetical protein
MLTDWILPILIGLVAAYLLLLILYNNQTIKQKFADLGALIQLQTSRPAYYGLGWVPVNWTDKVQLPPSSQSITTVDSPMYPGVAAAPIYNYYPATPIEAGVYNVGAIKSVVDSNDKAFNPGLEFNPYDKVYYGMSGLPVPVMIYPPTDIDAVKGVEEGI